MSIIYVKVDDRLINGDGAVDHILYSQSLNVNSVYSWDFLNSDEIYPSVEKIKIEMPWNISAAYPDLAMMISNIKINPW